MVPRNVHFPTILVRELVDRPDDPRVGRVVVVAGEDTFRDQSLPPGFQVVGHALVVVGCVDVGELYLDWCGNVHGGGEAVQAEEPVPAEVGQHHQTGRDHVRGPVVRVVRHV